MYVLLSFLQVNGIALSVNDEEIVKVGISLAEGKINYEELLQWIKDHEGFTVAHRSCYRRSYEVILFEYYKRKHDC